MGRKFDAVVLGAGAAGLMCAVEAGKRGRRVAVIERAEKIGKKILISGGGRCNFTNLYCTPENFLSANPHFAKSALARYTPADFIALVEKHRIPYHEKTLGQLFCDRSATDITQMLEAECRSAGAQIFLNQKVHEISRGTEFVVRTEKEEFRTPALVVATGGLSIPKMGATSFGYEVARQFGLEIQKTRPALVPLTLSAKERKRYCDLAGVSMDVIAEADGQRFREKMLVTHWGLSGPAILQISSYWEQGKALRIDLAPERNVTGAIFQGKTRNAAALRSACLGILPKRFAERWVELHEPKEWTNTALEKFEEQVHEWNVLPAGTEGYEKAEVTAGGMDTDELSSKTMECRNVPGLFFIGEVVDVTGHLGGFNFQWAWASGAAAGRAISQH
ncbi:MAG TPA: NAD(P)/FAD-dependent oxidoreductase [Candidatus Sulfotelmatobacter sp.]|jgi:predicted Rossmann fold flavoprotein|nr:NAD(P)/FAD-dependent oxidoreductase [Candidatus Sulfotelmatobacter sp.]